MHFASEAHLLADMRFLLEQFRAANPTSELPPDFEMTHAAFSPTRQVLAYAKTGTEMYQNDFDVFANDIVRTIGRREGARSVALFSTYDTLAIGRGRATKQLDWLINILQSTMPTNVDRVQYVFFPHVDKGHFFATILDVKAASLGYYTSWPGSYYKTHESLCAFVENAVGRAIGIRPTMSQRRKYKTMDPTTVEFSF